MTLTVHVGGKYHRVNVRFRPSWMEHRVAAQLLSVQWMENNTNPPTPDAQTHPAPWVQMDLVLKERLYCVARAEL